jgi:hypothetical protein
MCISGVNLWWCQNGTGDQRGTLLESSEIMNQVTQEKRLREEKKKQRAAEKKAEEDRMKVDKAQASATVVTIYPPIDTINQEANDNNLSNALYAMIMEELITHSIETYGYTQAEADLYAAAIEEKKQAIEMVEQQALCLDSAEAPEHLARHGMQPNQLFEENLETPAKEATAEVLNLSGNYPNKKKIKSTTGNRYTSKGFSLTPTDHPYSHPPTYVEATICLTSEDKPKEFINAIKLVLQNAKFLDPNFGLAPLKNTTGKPIRIITTKDDVPSNFTHLGQYTFTSGNRFLRRRRTGRGARRRNPIGTMQPRNLMTLLSISPLQSPPTSNLKLLLTALEWSGKRMEETNFKSRTSNHMTVKWCLGCTTFTQARPSISSRRPSRPFCAKPWTCYF